MMLYIAASPPVLASGLLASAASVPGPDIAKVRNSGLRSGGEAQQQQPGLQQPRGQRQENCAADTGTRPPVESPLSGYLY